MENNGRVFGVDFSEFTGWDCFSGRFKRRPAKGLLYYKDADLTDKYYIKNVYTWTGETFTNSGEHYIYVMGEVEEGDYLTTCLAFGAAMKTGNKELAFAQVVQGREPELNLAFPVIGGCVATFL